MSPKHFMLPQPTLQRTSLLVMNFITVTDMPSGSEANLFILTIITITLAITVEVEWVTFSIPTFEEI